MSKGDKQNAQNAINTQGGMTQNNLNNLRTDATRQNQQFENHYNQGFANDWQTNQNLTNQGQSNYDSIMNTPLRNFGAYGGYQDFANTGGFSDQNKEDFRARAESPIRATYANANADIDRAKSLQGGYAPNYIAAKAKTARDLSSSLGDAQTNVEASLADQIRQGKMAGLGGMTNIDSVLQKAALEKMGLGTGAFNAQTSLYGQAPGMSSMTGNQLNTSAHNLTDIEGIQGRNMSAILEAIINSSKIPGDFQQGMGNAGSLMSMIGSLSGAGSGMGSSKGGRGSSGGGNSSPYSGSSGGGYGNYIPDGYNPDGSYIPQQPDPTGSSTIDWGPYGPDPNAPPTGGPGEDYGTGDWWSQGD